MFISSAIVPPGSEAALQGFCAALNTPVVNIEELDVSPARAAIMLCADEYGELCLVVGVRSLSSGKTLTFKYQGDPEDFGSSSDALNAALCFAEGMGFIFEEDLIAEGGSAGRHRAWTIWNALMEPPGEEADDDAARDERESRDPMAETRIFSADASLEDQSATDSLGTGEAAEEDVDEVLLLEESVDAGDEVEYEHESEQLSSPVAVQETGGAAPRQLLTKFRSAPAVLPESRDANDLADRTLVMGDLDAALLDSADETRLDIASPVVEPGRQELNGFWARLLCSF